MSREPDLKERSKTIHASSRRMWRADVEKIPLCLQACPLQINEKMLKVALADSFSGKAKR